MRIVNDEPRSLQKPEVRAAREAAVWECHVAPLNSLVSEIPIAREAGKLVPYFDPADGGVEAQCLFLPGRAAGLPVVNQRVYFPSTGQQGKFREQFSQALVAKLVAV